MAERDRFELDLAAALRAYLEEAPTEVRPTELARHIATAYPHRRAAFGRRGFGLTPALAWLLLAGLLLAIVGGTLLVGSQLQRRLPAVLPPVGQLFECPPGSTPDEPGPVDQARPAGPPTVAFNSRAGRLVAVVGRSKAETWTFDVCTNTWTQMHPNREPSTFEWARLVYDVNSDVAIGVSRGHVWAYDLNADTWTLKGVAPTDALLWAYDPVSGLVVAASNGVPPIDMWNYDIETDAWTPIHQANGPGYGVFAYDASVDRIIAYGDGTWLFDIRTGTWSRTAETPGIIWGIGTPTIVYDEAAERTVVFGNGRLVTYDATADRWEVLIEHDHGASLEELPLCVADDPVNGRLVGCGYPGDAATHQADVIEAFDVASRQWTLLLGPGETQPADTLPTAPAPTSARTPTPSGGAEDQGLPSPVPTASPTSTPWPTPTP